MKSVHDELQKQKASSFTRRIFAKGHMVRVSNQVKAGLRSAEHMDLLGGITMLIWHHLPGPWKRDSRDYMKYVRK
jgi:hypothetical protein